MANDRKSRWKTPRLLLTFLSGDDKARLETVSKLQVSVSKKRAKAHPNLTSSDMIAACRELIFDVKAGVPIFHAIMYGIDTDHISVKVEHMLDIVLKENHSEEEIGEEVRNTLALAAAFGTPVYPNTDKVAPLLAKYHRQMLLEGFTAPDGKGHRIRLKLTRSLGKRIQDPLLITELDPTEMVSPADLLLIREAVSSEMVRLSGAKRVLAGIHSAVHELENLLANSDRNENALQGCLTDNPLLFGPEYVRVIPKHRLGSEFEMDYALEKHSGLVDLVEIEASSHPLFNKKGDPSSHLVHAEQQVMDWLHWIETNNPYARKGLPGLASPLGFVIIGRSSSLSEEGLERLRRRNSMFQPRMAILTYDQLVQRAAQLLRVLESVEAK